MLHPCGLPVILQQQHTATERLDEQAIGLDYLAFLIPDREALEAWARHLDQLGIAHSGIQEENGGPLIVFRDPDNIQLEVWAYDPRDGEKIWERRASRARRRRRCRRRPKNPRQPQVAGLRCPTPNR